MQDSQYDVIIVGGGMVGASLAVALQPLQLRVALVEAFPFNITSTQPAYDDRSVALSYGSSLIYQGMGLWELLRDQTSAIQCIHVSDRGYFGATRLYARQEQVPALGYVVESRVLGQVLYQAMKPGLVDILAPAKVEQVNELPENQGVRVHITESNDVNQRELQTRLLVVADGADSATRQQLGIAVQTHDYAQSAVIANVTTSKPHNGIAYERFTRSGPLALLPMTKNRYSLVWTHRREDVAATMRLGDQDFLDKLQQDFGYRQGHFIRIGQRHQYPLKLVMAQQSALGSAVVLGNAAHALHPVAGQGLNLALRDVAVLVDLLAAAKTSDTSDMQEVAAQYAQLRQTDFKTVVNYTDSLVKLFSLDFAPLGHLRAGGLLAVDRINALRHLLARQSMGLRAGQARLSRGLSLNATNFIR